tara:strand:- start:4658 stop:5677 length:1020 start_codon:yes stop_codon:yes gene_type:complete
MNYNQLTKFDDTLELVCAAPSSQESISTISDLDFMQPDCIVFLGDQKYLNKFLGLETKIKPHVIVAKKLEANFDQLKAKSLSIWSSEKPHVSITKISKAFYQAKIENLNYWHDSRQNGEAQVDPTSFIAQGVFLGEGVRIAADVKIHAGCVISAHAEIGEGSEIYPNCTIYPFTKIGRNVRIHANSTIGADGFGYNFDGGVHHKIWHLGGVVIEDHVEIGANSCVDAGTFYATTIGAGSKIDNHVQVGHNCLIGRGVIMCGHVAIAGSARIGDFTVIGGKAAVGNGVRVGNACQVAGNAMVTADIEDKAVVGGHPARPLKEWLKGVAWLRNQSLKTRGK